MTPLEYIKKHKLYGHPPYPPYNAIDCGKCGMEWEPSDLMCEECGSLIYTEEGTIEKINEHKSMIRYEEREAKFNSIHEDTQGLIDKSLLLD